MKERNKQINKKKKKKKSTGQQHIDTNIMPLNLSVSVNPHVRVISESVHEQEA